MKKVVHNGILCFFKPEGVTSFQALSGLKKIFGTNKVGHTGTLDKFATGVMIICIGSYTRLAQYVVGKSKGYTAVVKMGVETDTLDPEGSTVKEGDLPDLLKIEESIRGFIGEISQIPPRYSAIHVNGKRAHDRIRNGEDFEMHPRDVRIDSIDLISYENGLLSIDVQCSKGTYIRSLARDIAEAAGSCGSLAALSRTRVGTVHSKDCNTEEEIRENPVACLMTGGTSVQKILDLPIIILKPEHEFSFYNGKSVSEIWFKNDIIIRSENGTFLVADENDRIAGIVQKEYDRVTYACVFPR